MLIDMYAVMEKLSSHRQVFSSEADFQLELGWVLKEMYPDAKVRMEYCPVFDPNMHIDILLIMDDKWIPIELKYKTKGCKLLVNGDTYILKNHSAKDVNCYLCLKDIMRIEQVRDMHPAFYEGYAIFVTNDLSYMKKPSKSNCIYASFSLEQGAIKHGIMQWGDHASDGTKKGCEAPINLTGSYPISWHKYSHIDSTNTGEFFCLINQVNRNKEM